jgi:hypothetical protein
MRPNRKKPRTGRGLKEFLQCQGIQVPKNGRGPQGPFELRLRLIDAGYVPVALNGKIPVLDKWQKETGDRDNVKTWRRDFPFARGTGIVTRTVPSLDIDIKIAEAAVAVEELVRQRFADAGVFLVRIGQPPKRAIPFRTDTPFKKIVVPLIAPDGGRGATAGQRRGGNSVP